MRFLVSAINQGYLVGHEVSRWTTIRISVDDHAGDPRHAGVFVRAPE